MKKSRGLDGSLLKLIAIAAMLLDHIGAVILEKMLIQRTEGNYYSEDPLYLPYCVLRMIGRIGFPLFCFLLVEGFLHTRNAGRYAARLGIFALLSEVPFDLALHGRLVDTGYQNVFFTLLIGLMVLIGFRIIEEKTTAVRGVKLAAAFLVFLAGAGLAELLRTDYAAFGVLCIAMLYLFRDNRRYQLLAGCLVFSWEVTAPLAFLPIVFYNGKRGFGMKYFFYAFYPLHLLGLYFFAVFFGLT